MNIQYKTRGNSSPFGKSNVWLASAHCTETLTEHLVSDILASQNCAVWYPADTEECETLPADILAEMQLMVIPVTTATLIDNGHIIKELFSYAAKHHIPTLPILCENGLENIFNQQCGSLHCLSREMQDATTRSYTEKLKDYLNSVLHTDEDASRIRAAFPHSLFLSYRKRDRAVAQQLMRSIHASEEMRDTAIWYDEYLIPGENFNDAILDNLDRSNAFLLAVTPNLVCEDNYVRSVEYPRAVAQGKVIIPIEVLPTDRSQLSDAYLNLPPVLSSDDEEGIRAAILAGRDASDAVQKTRNMRYLLALAYLSGIGTEQDHDYACRVLYDCAVNGMPDAMKQLAVMYRYGIGVERNLNISANWYRRSAYLMDILHKTEGTDESAEARLCAYETLGDAYLEQKAYSQASGAYMDALYGFPQTAPTAPLHFASLYEKLGITYKFMNNISDARCYYEGALRYRADLPRTYDNLYASVTLNYRIGDTYMTLGGSGDDNKADTYYQAAAEEVKALLALDRNADSLRLECIIYEKRGDYCNSINETERAAELYQTYYTLATQLSAEYPSLASKRLLALATERLGNLARRTCNYALAIEQYLTSLALRENIRDTDATYEALRDIAVIHQKLGTVYLECNRVSVAEKHFNIADEYSSDLYEKTQSPDDAFDLAVIAERTGDVSIKHGVDEDVTIAIYTNALESYQKISNELMSPPLHIALAPAVVMDKIGHVYLDINDLGNAKDYFHRALELRMYLHRYHQSATLEREIGISYSYLEKIAIRELNFRDMKLYAQYACDPALAIENESASVSYRMSMDDFDEDENVLEGDDAYDNGDYETAATYFITAADGYLSKDDRHHVNERLETLALYFAYNAEERKPAPPVVGQIWSTLAERAFTEDYLKITAMFS